MRIEYLIFTLTFYNIAFLIEIHSRSFLFSEAETSKSICFF